MRTPVKAVAVWIGLSILVSVVLSAWLSWTESGRRWVADRIESGVSDAIPGSLKIGKLLELGPPLLVEDVRFFHPDGRVVLHAKRAEVVPNMWLAVQGKLGFDRADVEGGRIVLSPDPDGRIAFEAAVDKPAKPGEPSDPTGGLHYALQSMHVENYEVLLKLSDAADFKLVDVEGFVGVRRIETTGIRITLERISGRLDGGLLGKRTEIAKATGFVHAKVEHVVHLETAMKIGSGSLDATIDYYDRKKVPAVVRISNAEGEGSFVEDVLELGDDLFGESIEVKSEDEAK